MYRSSYSGMARTLPIGSLSECVSASISWLWSRCNTSAEVHESTENRTAGGAPGTVVSSETAANAVGIAAIRNSPVKPRLRLFTSSRMA